MAIHQGPDVVFLLIVGMGFLLLVSLVIDAMLGAVGAYLSSLLPASGLIMHLLNFIISIVVVTVLFG